MIDSIEFAETGEGPPVLLIHGAGGGFDQGLSLARAFLPGHTRVITPSRFGYLGTPMPADASPEAQADAHVRVLDALGIDSAAVVGVSAGAPSALQFCLRHPERCTALVLVVPMAYAPEHAPGAAPSPFFAHVLNAITASDSFFWMATKIARQTLLRTILGTPVEAYRRAPAEERRMTDEMLASILPISRRAAGIRNDAAIASTLAPRRLEDIRVAALLISAEDDGYRTYESARYTAEHIPGATFVGFRKGGHLLLGHDAEVRAKLAAFLEESLETRPAAASSVL